jgi:hypothetical protein
MTIQIENISKQMNEGQTWFSFSLTLAFPALGQVKTKGWRYFPSTAGLGAPGVNKGTKKNPHWVTTQWIEGKLYELVCEYVPHYFISHGFCEEPWESPEVRKAVFEGMSNNQQKRKGKSNGTTRYEE